MNATKSLPLSWQEMVHALRDELVAKENSLEEVRKAVKEVSTNIVSTLNAFEVWFEICTGSRFLYSRGTLHPFTPKISLVILPTVSHTTLMILVQRICYWII